jgi:hypothetical protein
VRWLLVGGILAGRELIEAAEMRGQISQLQKIEQALLAFRMKYNCLAGDCATATLFFDQDCPVVGADINGNGDGRLSFALTFVFSEHEDYKILCHLSQAGLLAEEVSASGSAISAKLSATTLNWVGYHYFFGWDSPQWKGYHLFTAAPNTAAHRSLSPMVAYNIDQKRDDGMPGSGSVIASNNESSDPFLFDPITGAAGSDACVVDTVTPNVYNLIGTDPRACGLAFRMPGGPE